jgi:hypothetical protein
LLVALLAQALLLVEHLVAVERSLGVEGLLVAPGHQPDVW